MINRIIGSISFRSASICRNIFALLPLTVQPTRTTHVKYTFLTLVGREQLGLLRASLWSMAAAATALPPVVIACDFSVEATEVLQALQWWPARLTIQSAAEIIDFHRDRGHAELAEFATNNPMGLKLAALIRAVGHSPTLYADTDVLWFRDPLELMQMDAPIQMQLDRQASYDERVLEFCPQLRNAPFFCAGITWLAADLCTVCPRFFEVVRRVREGRHPFAEQTILAAANRTAGNHTFTWQAAFLGWSDQMEFGPTFTGKCWIARHYVGPVRHLFWQDALALWFRAFAARH